MFSIGVANRSETKRSSVPPLSPDGYPTSGASEESKNETARPLENLLFQADKPAAFYFPLTHVK
jgi:hypothetical protein